MWRPRVGTRSKSQRHSVHTSGRVNGATLSEIVPRTLGATYQQARKDIAYRARLLLASAAEWNRHIVSYQEQVILDLGRAAGRQSCCGGETAVASCSSSSWPRRTSTRLSTSRAPSRHGHAAFHRAHAATTGHGHASLPQAVSTANTITTLQAETTATSGAFASQPPAPTDSRPRSGHFYAPAPIQPALLTSRIKRCTSWQQLADLYRRHGSQMDFIHLSAALTHLAKLQPAPDQLPSQAGSSSHPPPPPRSPPSTRPATATGNTEHASSSVLVQHLVHDLVQALPSLRARELCNVLWAFSKLGGARAWAPPAPNPALGDSTAPRLQPREALEAMLGELPRCLPACNGQELSNMVYALATIGRPLNGQTRRPAGLRGWATRTGLSAGAATAAGSGGQGAGAAPPSGQRADSTAMTAASEEAGCGIDLQRVVLRRLGQAVQGGELGPQALANTTWALGRLARLGDWGGAELVPALLGPSALGGPALHALPPAGLSSVAVGLAWLGARPDAAWCSRFGHATGRSFAASSVQGLCNMLWGLVSMGRRPPGQWLAALLHEVQRRLDAGQLSQPLDAALLLFCLARLGVRPPLRMLAPLMAVVYAGLGPAAGRKGGGGGGTAAALSPQGMANLMLALWRLGVRPSTPWVEALLRAAYAAAPGFSPQGAHMVLSGLEGMGFKPSRRFVERLGAHMPEGWREEAETRRCAARAQREQRMQAAEARWAAQAVARQPARARVRRGADASQRGLGDSRS